MRSCCVPGCINTSLNAPDLTFHSFAKDKSREIKWMDVINKHAGHLKNKITIVHQHTKICSAHFLPFDLYYTAPGRKRLKMNALPTIFNKTHVEHLLKYQGSETNIVTDGKESFAEKEMPKEKQQVRTQSRRAASKQALKNMHSLLGEENRYEISSDDDDVIEVEVQPPKKKYKLSHRKSSDGNDRDVIVLKSVDDTLLDLDVVIEDLAPSQKTFHEQLKKENQEIDTKVEQLLATPNVEIVYNGIFSKAVEITEQIQTIITNAATTTQYTTVPQQGNSLSSTTSSLQQAVPGQSIVLQQQGSSNNTMPQSYQLVMDPRLGVIVGTMATTNPSQSAPPLLYQPKVTMATGTSTNNDQNATIKTRRGTLVRTMPPTQMPPLHKTTLVQQQQQKSSPMPPNKQKGTLQVKKNLVSVSPTVQPKASPGMPTKGATPKTILPMKGRMRANNLMPGKKPIANQVNKAANSPATATSSAPFRPTESSVEGGLGMGKPNKSIDLTGEDGRALPDSREVSFNKLQGRTYPSLVVVARPHLRVKDLAADRGKLDVKVKSVLMYPPTKFTEWLIQQGLVRSDQKCTIHAANALKLGMYSDVTKFPYSGGYVWISECCPQRFISVFSGSLFEGSQHPPMAILKLLYHWCCQTIVQNVTQWVKVDNLYVKGMYTWLRSICTVALHTHIKQLGGPGVKVQVGVISLGTTSQDGNKREVKVEVLGILETTSRHIRLRAVEPQADGERNYKKRFTKILEPVFNWVHPSSVIVTDLTVDKATLHQMGFLHVTQNTSTDYATSNRTIMEYLRRIVPRMFQNTLSLLSRQIIQQFLDELVWREWYGTTVLQSFDNMIQHLSEQTRHDSSGQSLVVRLNKVSANPFKNWSIPLAGTSTALPAIPKTIEATPTPKRYSRQRKPITPQPPQSAVQDVARPAKSTSPDVPEQMVPLENYYYGTINPRSEKSPKISISIKCPFCKLNFNTNIALMNHLFKHAHNVSNDVQLCRYCLTIVPSSTDLVKHINTSHPDETKFDNGFVCLICEVHFRNPFILGKHMSKEHSPSELPYLCGTCGFRCSNHKQAVDHFYQNHDQGTTIQCPFCLKSTTIYSGGRNISQNMNYFIQHLQKHQKKQLAKRCGKCTLWFIQKEFLKDHQIKMHVSQRGKNGLVPSFAPRNGVMVPKSRMDKCPDDGKVINFSTLYFNVGKTLNCKECDQLLSNPKHFVSFESCQNSNCQYSTCCSNAMQQHITVCKSLHTDLPAERLPFEMFCICGYRDIYGNQMAKHLAICERKSAYPSKQAAKGATVTQCMLDVLGLVRKPEEAKEAKELERPLLERKSSSSPEPKSTNSAQPIILKHRGRPRKNTKYSNLLPKPPEGKEEELEEEIFENKDKEVSEIKLESDVEINISEVRGGVDIAESTDVKEESDNKEESQVPEEVDLTENDSNEEAGDEVKAEKETEREKEETPKEKETVSGDKNDGTVNEANENNEVTEMVDGEEIDKAGKEKDDDATNEKEKSGEIEKDIVVNNKTDKDGGVNEDIEKDESASEDATEKDDGVSEVVTDKGDGVSEDATEKDGGVSEDIEKDDAVSEDTEKEEVVREDTEKDETEKDDDITEDKDTGECVDGEKERSEKSDDAGEENEQIEGAREEISLDNTDNEVEKEGTVDDVSQEEISLDTTDNEVEKEKRTDDEQESEIGNDESERSEQIESEDTQDGVVSEEKEITEDEESSQSNVVNTNENTEDADQTPEKNDECERMEVDSCSNTETVGKVAIDTNDGESENINDICPMDTD